MMFCASVLTGRAKNRASSSKVTKLNQTKSIPPIACIKWRFTRAFGISFPSAWCRFLKLILEKLKRNTSWSSNAAASSSESKDALFPHQYNANASRCTHQHTVDPLGIRQPLTCLPIRSCLSLCFSTCSIFDWGEPKKARWMVAN